MNDTAKKNLGLVLLLITVGLQFFSYLGSGLVTINISKSIHGFSSLKSDRPLVVDWVWVTVFGRITGAYILCRLALYLGFFKVMRMIVICHILLAISISLYSFNDAVLYQNLQFLFVHRFIHAFLIPASFMLPSLFLLNHYTDKPIMLSAYICLGIGLGSIFLYKYLAIVKFAEGWHNSILYASVVSAACYFIGEKFLCREIKGTPNKPYNTIQLPPSRLFMVCVFGGVCGITFSYHFAFVDHYVKNVVMSGDCQNAGFSYYYYTLLAAIVPVAKLIYKADIFTPLKFSSFGVSLMATVLAISPKISLYMYIAEQVIFGVLAAVLLVPCHAFVYQLFKDTKNYFDGMFWFVTGFTLFAITPHFFLNLLGVKSQPWLGVVYIVPISFLFIFILSKYEKELKSSAF